jgi:hypothetical protein
MKILSSIDESKDIVNKEYIDALDLLGFEIVNSLPSGTDIDEDTIYLIENGEGGGGGGSTVTYILSKSGSTITLTGSDSSTSSVTVNEMTSQQVQAMIDAAVGDALGGSY